MKGFVNICKPANMTSSDVVVKVRGILRRFTGEKQKTGHLGTLDPLAVGVLPIAVGAATRLFDYMQSKSKKYIAVFKFGETTDTLDSGGKITDTCAKRIQTEDVSNAIPRLLGDIEQMPPQYSAKSVNGRKAYDIARAGGIAELQPKKVRVHDIKLLGVCGDTVIDCGYKETEARLESLNVPTKYDYDVMREKKLEENEFAFEITCGSGTYIRSIARDMAELMGSVGYMKSLCRVETGDFSLKDAVTLEQFETDPLRYVLPIEFALKNYMNIDLDEIQGSKILNGVKIPCDTRYDSPMTVSVCGDTVGIGEIQNGMLRIKTRL